MTERSCTRCEVLFEPYQWNQKKCYDCIEATDPRFKGKPKRNCKNCGVEFQPRTIRQTQCSSECGEERRSSLYYYREYGIHREDFERMLEEAGHRCQICGSEGFIMNQSRHRQKLVVDHCHDSGIVRGVLCHNCNRALGLMQDDTEALKRAIEYLSGSDR